MVVFALPPVVRAIMEVASLSLILVISGVGTLGSYPAVFVTWKKLLKIDTVGLLVFETVAVKVQVVLVVAVFGVGAATVRSGRFSAQIDPFHTVPATQLAVAVVEASSRVVSVVRAISRVVFFK